jgi:hypothetical protein
LPARPLHPAVQVEGGSPASRPPAPKGKPLRKPAVFLCPSVPALALGPHQFQYGRLTLVNSADVAAIRLHPWFGVRIFLETPAIRKQLDADAALRAELDEKQRELADAAANTRKLMGPRGSLGPAEPLAQFPVRGRRRSW